MNWNTFSHEERFGALHFPYQGVDSRHLTGASLSARWPFPGPKIDLQSGYIVAAGVHCLATRGVCPSAQDAAGCASGSGAAYPADLGSLCHFAQGSLCRGL